MSKKVAQKWFHYLEKLKILTPLKKLPTNVGDFSKSPVRGGRCVNIVDSTKVKRKPMLG